MSALVRGSDLSPSIKAEVLRSYVHRLTVENGYPKRNPTGATVAPITDAEWLAQYGFHVTAKGTLDKRHHQAWWMGQPTKGGV